MKIFLRLVLASLVIVLILVSCKKYSTGNPTYGVTGRKVRFRLYTNDDFSTNTSVIKFSLVIRDGNINLFDSSVAPMEIRNIPHLDHELVIEKTVQANVNSTLTAGFLYDIENVGNSWFLDTMKAGSTFKVIDYAFR